MSRRCEKVRKGEGGKEEEGREDKEIRIKVGRSSNVKSMERERSLSIGNTRSMEEYFKRKREV